MNEITKKILENRLINLTIDFDSYDTAIDRINREKNKLIKKYDRVVNEINKIREDLDNG